MITIKVEEDYLLDLLMDRVSYWTKDDPIEEELFEKMYSNYIDGGCFEGMELNIMYLVDNDYVNYTRVVYEGEDEFEELLTLYKNNGCGDVSCETDICNFIEAVTEDETAILIR